MQRSLSNPYKDGRLCTGVTSEAGKSFRIGTG
jgi:hypothetical protein